MFEEEEEEDDFSPSWDAKSSEEVLKVVESSECAPFETPTEEEKKSLLKRFIEWLKQLPARIKSKLLGLELDLDGKLTLQDLLGVRRVYRWYKNGNGTEIRCPTELRAGDHIAVKTKRSRLWWNHMIVTDVYYDGFDVICPCKPALEQENVKLESDYFSLKDLTHYFRLDHRQSEMKVWEFPMSWDSVRKVVRFDHDDQGSSGREKIVQRAREKLESGELWDLYNKTAEEFVSEMVTGRSDDIDDDQKRLREQGIALACEVGIGGVSVTVKKIHLIFRVVLWVVKFIIKQLSRDAGRILKSVAIISKMVKVLGILGFCIGPIVDSVICVVAIINKRQRYKNNEITKSEFHKFLAQKIAELLTNLLFSALAVPCFFIPLPVVGAVVGFFIGVIGFLATKAVGWGVGYFWDKIHND